MWCRFPTMSTRKAHRQNLLKKGLTDLPPPPSSSSSPERQFGAACAAPASQVRAEVKRAHVNLQHKQMLWMHQEAHVTPFTCAEGGEGWRAGHQWTLPTSEHLRSASLSPPVLGMTDSAMCCHLRSAPKLGGVQTARAEAEKLVHVQRVCVQMYVHMLYECGRLCRTLSHVTLLAVPNWLWKQRFTS